jgi:hypothetical protein
MSDCMLLTWEAHRKVLRAFWTWANEFATSSMDAARIWGISTTWTRKIDRSLFDFWRLLTSRRLLLEELGNPDWFRIGLSSQLGSPSYRRSFTFSSPQIHSVICTAHDTEGDVEHWIHRTHFLSIPQQVWEIYSTGGVIRANWDRIAPKRFWGMDHQTLFHW